VRLVGPCWASAYVRIGWARLALARGREDEALEALEEARAHAEHTGDEQALHAAQTLLAEWELVRSRPQAARARLEALLGGASRELATGLADGVLAWALADLGETERAADLVDGAITAARKDESLLDLVELLHVQARIAIHAERWEAAAHALDEALAACRPLPNPYAEARLCYIYGLFHAARGEPEQARERFRAALAIVNRLGERLYAEQVERALAEIG
jgi:tetratricopeptide (TPR) repeat protein